MSFIPNTLYYASAAIHAISIPGHIMFGINEVDPAIAAIPSKSEHALGKATATTAWDMVNVLLAASGKHSRLPPNYYSMCPLANIRRSTSEHPMGKTDCQDNRREVDSLGHGDCRSFHWMEVLQAEILRWPRLFVVRSLDDPLCNDLSERCETLSLSGTELRDVFLVHI